MQIKYECWATEVCQSLTALGRHEMAVLFLQSGKFLGRIQTKRENLWCYYSHHHKGRSQVAYIIEEERAFFSFIFLRDFLWISFQLLTWKKKKTHSCLFKGGSYIKKRIFNKKRQISDNDKTSFITSENKNTLHLWLKYLITDTESIKIRNIWRLRFQFSETLLFLLSSNQCCTLMNLWTC